MIQSSLTYAPAVDKLCGARRTDPLSSHEADEEHRNSGRARTHCRMILDVLKNHAALVCQGNLTSHEVAYRLPFDSVEAGRRLSDLLRLNLVEQVGRKRCSVTGRKLTAWRIV